VGKFPNNSQGFSTVKSDFRLQKLKGNCPARVVRDKLWKSRGCSLEKLSQFPREQSKGTSKEQFFQASRGFSTVTQTLLTPKGF
jgi:hypothetical protein